MLNLNKKERETTIEVPVQTTPWLALVENDVWHNILAHFMGQTRCFLANYIPPSYSNWWNVCAWGVSCSTRTTKAPKITPLTHPDNTWHSSLPTDKKNDQLAWSKFITHWGRGLLCPLVPNRAKKCSTKSSGSCCITTSMLNYPIIANTVLKFNTSFNLREFGLNFKQTSLFKTNTKPQLLKGWRAVCTW